MESNTKHVRFNHKCDTCDFTATRPCEWFLHIKTNKHLRRGQAKTKICDICNVEFATHGVLKLHKLKIHASVEERSKMKYYCKECDIVFLSKQFMDTHINGKIHKNLIKALDIIKDS